MTYQRLLSYTRKAVDEYQMIQEGDQIAVGVSGGKDSITLALALKGLQRFYPQHFTLKAYTVALGFPEMDYRQLQTGYSIFISFHRYKCRCFRMHGFTYLCGKAGCRYCNRLFFRKFFQ